MPRQPSVSFFERIIIFIDGSNFYRGCQECCKRHDIDFSGLAEKLCRGRRLIRTYYYNAPVPQSEAELYKNQQRFLGKMKNTPYLTVILGSLEKRSRDKQDYWVEKGVDIAIAVDMIRLAHADAYDTAVLVSGDRDFVKAVQAVQDFGKHVENAYFQRGGSRHLMEAADRFILLDMKTLNGCWLRT